MRGNERLAFARRHFRDLALVNRDAANELDVEMNHCPSHGLVAHREGVPAFGEAARGLLDHGERFRKDFLRRAASTLESLIAESSCFHAEVLARKASSESSPSASSISLTCRTTG